MSLLLPRLESQWPRIGIMGGTFDPIHIGHLVTAEEAREHFNLESVIFVPAGLPSHKIEKKVTDPEHRYLMTFLAVTNNPYFSISRVEIDSLEPSYTVNTVRFFQKIYDYKVSIYFITGADAILDILTWKDYEELLEKCIFIAASRSGYSLEKLKDKVEPFYPSIFQKVHLMEIPAMAISSTFIRRRVREGKTIKYLTPEAVEQYIYKSELYQEEAEKSQ